jgi:hypothetical protein
LIFLDKSICQKLKNLMDSLCLTCRQGRRAGQTAPAAIINSQAPAPAGGRGDQNFKEVRFPSVLCHYLSTKAMSIACDFLTTAFN